MGSSGCSCSSFLIRGRLGIETMGSATALSRLSVDDDGCDDNESVVMMRSESWMKGSWESGEEEELRKSSPVRRTDSSERKVALEVEVRKRGE